MNSIKKIVLVVGLVHFILYLSPNCQFAQTKRHKVSKKDSFKIANEAFVASEFKPAVENNSKGRVIVINCSTHQSVRHNITAMDTVKVWYNEHYLDK